MTNFKRIGLTKEVSLEDETLVHDQSGTFS